jgi:hypothetical protein
LTTHPLTVKRIAEVDVDLPTHRWLVEDLWGRGAVGIVGGAPKCCKSWLGLDIALSVASGTPCLGRFPVVRAGPALVYLAEDAAPMVRERILGICNHRRLDIHALDLHLIDTPSLRLDLDVDRTRLAAAVETIRPKILILDPLVRLHRADENSSADISALLGFLRELQRRFDTAVLLVHHMSKRHRAQLGQALRGSGDLHAFGDCNAYLVRKNDKLLLSVEQRFAKETDPISLALVSDDNGADTHLEVLDRIANDQRLPLSETVRITLADTDKPLTRAALRQKLRVNNHRLGLALAELEQRHIAIRENKGWTLVPKSDPAPTNASPASEPPLFNRSVPSPP